MFEIYTMNDDPLTESDDEALCAQLKDMLLQYDVVIVADYGHAMLTHSAIRMLCENARFLAVNTQVNAGNMGYHTISKYPRADYVCLADQELRLEYRNRGGDLHQMLQKVAHRLDAPRAVVTLGSHGCLGYNQSVNTTYENSISHESFYEAPALATQVVDRVGAGDALLAITSLCAAQDASMDILTFLGNVAGAEAVATVGNRDTLQQIALCRHVESLLK